MVKTRTSPVKVRICQGCGKPKGCFSFVMPGSKPGEGVAGYWHLKCFARAVRQPDGKPVAKHAVSIAPRKRRSQDVTAFEHRCTAASDAQIAAVQTQLRLCATAACQAVPGGAPDKFLTAIDALRSAPLLMLDVAPEFRRVVESALDAVGA